LDIERLNHGEISLIPKVPDANVILKIQAYLLAECQLQDTNQDFDKQIRTDNIQSDSRYSNRFH
jgi:hypothetical protein